MSIVLPQPKLPRESAYKYIRHEEIEKSYYSSQLKEGTLCWVLLSKGRRRTSDTTTTTTPPDDGASTSPSSSSSGQRCPELFNRARVVRDDSDNFHDKNRRVLVRYPKGSTYRVKRCNLIPTLEDVSDRLAIVFGETPEYRRGCIMYGSSIHQNNENISFLEIGCDFGPTIHRVQEAILNVGVPPLDEKNDDESPPPSFVLNSSPEIKKCNGKSRVHCLGIDKSETSIEIAKNRYPDCHFFLGDALSENGLLELQQLCQSTLVGGFPTVVAIDINGNRMLPAVLDCIANVMKRPPPSCYNNDSDGNEDGKSIESKWKLPQFILIKSRFLHQELKSRQEGKSS